MNDSDLKNIFLLYEFNERSPFFARIAGEKIEEHDYELASEILKEGIQNFPHYATAYFLLSVAEAHKGNFEEAEKYLAAGQKLLGDAQTAEFYQQLIKKLKNHSENSASPSLESKEQEKPLAEESNTEPPPLEERLEEIARELETAPPIPPVREEESVFETAESPSVEEFETPEIASETMAMILESQGKYEEARKVYEKLIETEPDKKEIFELKIKELSERNAENDG